MIDRIVAIGASITAGPWLTWLDFLAEESQMPVTNLAVKGVGNEYMSHAIAKQANVLDERSLAVVMLTNIDKWDWYVQGPRMQELQHEKHQPIPFGKDSGFWCTGRWFPGLKEIYKDNFYEQDYFVAKTIQSLMLLQAVCHRRHAKLEIFFDSPIWTYTEQDISHKLLHQSAEPKKMLDGDLARIWRQFLPADMIDIEDKSLIGYCWRNGLRFGNITYGNHPPSSSHWRWYRDIVAPRMDVHMHLHDKTEHFRKKIEFFDNQWQKS